MSSNQPCGRQTRSASEIHRAADLGAVRFYDIYEGGHTQMSALAKTLVAI